MRHYCTAQVLDSLIISILSSLRRDCDAQQSSNANSLEYILYICALQIILEVTYHQDVLQSTNENRIIHERKRHTVINIIYV